MKHILVIDDDQHIGDLLQEALTKQGYRVSRAYSGTEALLLVGAARPDLVLLDLMLPGLSGEELLPRLRGMPASRSPCAAPRPLKTRPSPFPICGWTPPLTRSRPAASRSASPAPSTPF